MDPDPVEQRFGGTLPLNNPAAPASGFSQPSKNEFSTSPTNYDGLPFPLTLKTKSGRN